MAQFEFGPFRLDTTTRQLWRDEQAVAVQPRPLAVLQYFVAHPGQVISSEVMLKEIWAGTLVGKAALKVCIRAIREVLGDDAEDPQYVETVGRVGYRFIAPVAAPAAPVSSSKSHAAGLSRAAAPSPEDPTPTLVGREAELADLHQRLDTTLRGQRQFVFVTGEPGIGKTALVDRFLEQVSARGQVWIGRGQCLEQYGEGEAYLPVLEAVGQLWRAPGGQQVLEVLRQAAPTWLLQMPLLVSEAEGDSLQRKTAGATRARMLREMAEALEALTAIRGLVLVFEDLHWSDRSTLELLAYLAQRREHARLCVLCTYRPADVAVREHSLQPIKEELRAHGQCSELPLALLTEAEVAAYLRQRCGTQRPSAHLAAQIHRRTKGNALFMVALAEHYAHEGSIAGDTVPATLQQMIGQQIARLTAVEQRVLEGASVAGMEFSSAAVGAGLGLALEVVEEVCEVLSHAGHVLRAAGVSEWPDGVLSGRYGFRHALYQQVVYQRIAEVRRVRLHRLLGQRQEQAYGERAREVAAELALHFERGRDYSRAIRYLQQAGENAIRRSAHQEAISLLTRGLELLKTLPDTPEHTRRELTLQVTLGESLIATSGPGAPEVGRVYTGARALCQQVGEPPQLFSIENGLWAFYAVRAEYRAAREVAEQMLAHARRLQSSASLLTAHVAMGFTLYFLGDLAPAREHFEQGLALSHSQEHHTRAARRQEVYCRSYAAWSLWMLGYPDQAVQRTHEALSIARQLAHPYILAEALSQAAAFHLIRGDEQTAREYAEHCIALSTEHEFAYELALGTSHRGEALARHGQLEEGIALMRQGQSAWWATGTGLARSYMLGVLAEMYGAAGRAEEGLCLLADALAHVHNSGERYYEAELYRLEGELTLLSRPVENKSKTSRGQVKPKSPISPRPPTSSTQAETEAEACFLKAIAIARQQQAKSLELRAAVSLARWWPQRGKREEARQMLAEIYGWFTEGFDTKDLQGAKALLAELG